MKHASTILYMKQTHAENSSKYRCNTDWIFHRKSICSCSKDGWQAATLRPLDVKARKLCGDPNFNQCFWSEFHPPPPSDLILAVIFHFALLSKHLHRTQILNCNVKTSNVTRTVDWICSSLGRFPKLRTTNWVLWLFIRASSDCTYTLQRRLVS